MMCLHVEAGRLLPHGSASLAPRMHMQSTPTTSARTHLDVDKNWSSLGAIRSFSEMIGHNGARCVSTQPCSRAKSKDDNTNMYP